ncbi:hypothetical protein [Candidatus Kuenenia stuttgartiensis]|uniref:hypothetical protein n=1 Tax=Kuenenia stuttgartiensis TaxID=174633 RepID=UPI00146AA2D5|nr:hypothetical protein [Candidatus Kuenenia stuttgartiensis]
MLRGSFAFVTVCISGQSHRADSALLAGQMRYNRLNQPLKAAEIYELVDSHWKSTIDSLNMLG